MRDALEKIAIIDGYAGPGQFIGLLEGFTAFEEPMIDVEMLCGTIKSFWGRS